MKVIACKKLSTRRYQIMFKLLVKSSTILANLSDSGPLLLQVAFIGGSDQNKAPRDLDSWHVCLKLDFLCKCCKYHYIMGHAEC